MQSETIDLLATALAKAQAVMEAAKFDKKNPHFGNKYSSLAAVIEAVRKPLTDNGISFTQTTNVGEHGFFLETTLLHSSGQWIRSEYPLPQNATAQQTGSALTYARRYCLSAITGTAGDEDDDAEQAEKSKPAEYSAPKPKAEPVQKSTPREIPRPADIKAVDWGRKLVEQIKLCDEPSEIDAWMAVNDRALKDLEAKAPQVYDRVVAVEKSRREQLGQVAQ